MDREQALISLSRVKVGAWQSMCCHLDLYQIENEQQAEKMREELRSAISDEDYALLPTVWESRNDALDELGKQRWSPPSAQVEMRREIELMRADPTLVGSHAHDTLNRLKGETNG